MCYTYGRSKTFIKQRRKKIEKQLKKAENALKLFEQQTSSNCAQETDGVAVLSINVLSSIVGAFVHKRQQKLRDDFQYNRKMLLWDSTDDHLVQAFFHLKPMKKQVGYKILSFFLLTTLRSIISLIDSVSKNHLANNSKTKIDG
jgi:hypothetical protein